MHPLFCYCPLFVESKEKVNSISGFLGMDKNGIQISTCSGTDSAGFRKACLTGKPRRPADGK